MLTIPQQQIKMVVLAVFLLLTATRSSNAQVVAAPGSSTIIKHHPHQHNNQGNNNHQIKCHAKHGAFGTLGQGTLLQVPYAFALQLAAGTDVTSVIAPVETVLVDRLVPFSFRQCTTADDVVSDAIWGIQSVPAVHNAIEAVPCRGSSRNSSDNCYILRGQMHVWLDDSSFFAHSSVARQILTLDLFAVLTHELNSNIKQSGDKKNQYHQQQQQHSYLKKNNKSGVLSISAVDVTTIPTHHKQQEQQDEANDASIIPVVGSSSSSSISSPMLILDAASNFDLALSGSALFAAVVLMILLHNNCQQGKKSSKREEKHEHVYLPLHYH